MIVEIRTYRLRPGTRDEFVRVMREDGVPLMADFGVRVVSCEASLVDEEGHQEAVLVRAFESLDTRDEQEAELYRSQAWRQGPREPIVSRIDSMHTIVLETSEDGLRAFGG